MILGLLAALFIFLGFAIQKLKWYFLISGYNTMSKEQQAQVDVKGLGKLIAMYAYFLAGLFVLMALFEWFNIPEGLIGCIVVLVVSTIFIAVKSQKYYANVTANVDGKSRSKGKKWSIILSVVSVIGVGILLFFSMQPTKFTVSEASFEISGMYGDTFAWEALEELSLVQEIPAISMRTNGSAMGSMLKGHFKFESGEKGTLFVDKKKPPFITFVVNGKRYYLNEGTAEETKALFEKMLPLSPK